MRARELLRWVLVGRRNGLRAGVRRRLGFLRWLDREAAGAEATAPPPVPGRVPAAASDPLPSQPPESGSPASDQPPPDPASGWVRVLDELELEEGALVEILVGERPVVLARVEGRVCALDGTCPHAGGPLGLGTLEGPVLTCPWHGWGWDVRTGRSLVDEERLAETLQARTAEGGIWVRAAGG